VPTISHTDAGGCRSHAGHFLLQRHHIAGYFYRHLISAGLQSSGSWIGMWSALESTGLMIQSANHCGTKPAVVTAGLVLKDCRVVLMGGGTRQHARQSAAVGSAVHSVRSAVGRYRWYAKYWSTGLIAYEAYTGRASSNFEVFLRKFGSGASGLLTTRIFEKLVAYYGQMPYSKGCGVGTYGPTLLILPYCQCTAN
jgi:hypothetical protein